MKFLADENIPVQVCLRLRKKGIDIISVSEVAAGASDTDVVSRALKENRAVMTYDTGFGELVFKKKRKVPAVILLRFSPRSPSFVFKKIADLLLREDIPFEDSFVVVESDRVRTRKIP
jgi:predicted nuclease of predicted toxin-antitoxin system